MRLVTVPRQTEELRVGTTDVADEAGVLFARVERLALPADDAPDWEPHHETSYCIDGAAVALRAGTCWTSGELDTEARVIFARLDVLLSQGCPARLGP